MDTKISQLPLLNTVTGNEDIPAVVNGQNVRIKSSSLLTQASGPTAISGVAGLQTALDGKVDDAELVAGLATKASGADLVAGLAGKAATTHNHAITDVTGLQTALDGKTDLAAVDARIQAVVGAAPEALNTLAEVAAQLADDESAVAALTTTVAGKANTVDVTTALAGKADSVHSHAIAGVTGLQTALDAKANTADVATLLAGKSDTVHAHGISDITGLQTALSEKADLVPISAALADKADNVHTHSIANVTGLQTALDGKTDLAAVEARIQAVVGAAPEALDTLAEIASQLQDDSSAVAALTATVAGKADSVHSHAIAGVTGLQAALDAKATPADITAAVADKADTSALTSGLAGKAATVHSHAIADTTGLQAALDSKTDLAAVDARIQAVVGAAPEALDTLAEIASQLQDDSSAVAALTTTVAGKAAVSHGHVIADVTGLQTALDTKADLIPMTAALADKADNTHIHAVADVTGLQGALDSKSDTEHAHDIADVTGLQASLNGKASSSHNHAYADISDLNALLAHIKRNTVWPTLSVVISNVTAVSFDVEVSIDNTNGYQMTGVTIQSAAWFGGATVSSQTETFENGTSWYVYTVLGLTAETEYTVITGLVDPNNTVDDYVSDVTTTVTTTAA